MGGRGQGEREEEREGGGEGGERRGRGIKEGRAGPAGGRSGVEGAGNVDVGAAPISRSGVDGGADGRSQRPARRLGGAGRAGFSHPRTCGRARLRALFV